MVFVLELLQIAHQVLSKEARVQDNDANILGEDENPLDPEGGFGGGGADTPHNNSMQNTERVKKKVVSKGVLRLFLISKV